MQALAVASVGAMWLCSAMVGSTASSFTGCAFAGTASAVVYCLCGSQGSHQKGRGYWRGLGKLWVAAMEQKDMNGATNTLFTRR